MRITTSDQIKDIEAIKMEIKTMDITKSFGRILEKAGLGDDGNNEKEISKAGIYDLCDALSGKDNSKFSVDQARAEMSERGL